MKRMENLAVNSLIKLILNHLYRPILSLLLPEKYLIEHSVFFHVQSENLDNFFCNMNFDEIDNNCSGGNTYLLHTNKLFICQKFYTPYYEGYDMPLQYYS